MKDTNDTIKLTNRDRDLFLKVLENPPEPPSQLKQAMKKYKTENSTKKN